MGARSVSERGDACICTCERYAGDMREMCERCAGDAREMRGRCAGDMREMRWEICERCGGRRRSVWTRHGAECGVLGRVKRHSKGGSQKEGLAGRGQVAGGLWHSEGGSRVRVQTGQARPPKSGGSGWCGGDRRGGGFHERGVASRSCLVAASSTSLHQGSLAWEGWI